MVLVAQRQVAEEPARSGLGQIDNRSQIIDALYTLQPLGVDEGVIEFRCAVAQHFLLRAQVEIHAVSFLIRETVGRESAGRVQGGLRIRAKESSIDLRPLRRKTGQGV